MAAGVIFPAGHNSEAKNDIRWQDSQYLSMVLANNLYFNIILRDLLQSICAPLVQCWAGVRRKPHIAEVFFLIFKT